MDCWEGVDSERVKSVANMLFTLWLFSYVDIRGRSRTQMRLYNFIYLKMDMKSLMSFCDYAGVLVEGNCLLPP